MATASSPRAAIAPRSDISGGSCTGRLPSSASPRTARASWLRVATRACRTTAATTPTRSGPARPSPPHVFPAGPGGAPPPNSPRRFSRGPAPEPLQKVYRECREAFDTAMSRMRGGESCRGYQELVCDVFERQGHATVRVNQGVEEGYVHGLGHGVGLAVHEGPRLGGPPTNTALLEPGHVISVEPGLYYPSRGLGGRIADLVAVKADGGIENLTPAPYELEIPIRS